METLLSDRAIVSDPTLVNDHMETIGLRLYIIIIIIIITIIIIIIITVTIIITIVITII